MRFLFCKFTVDDAFITFRYAKNLAEGKGFVYNPGENVLGITNPLYGLIIALGIKFGLDPIVFSKILGLLLYLLISIEGYVWLKKRSGDVPAMFFVTFLAFDHYTSKWFVSGMETALYAFLIFTSVLLFLEGRKTLAYLFASVSYFVRPEGAILIPVYFIFDKSLKNAAAGALPIMLSFLLYFKLYSFPIPFSIHAKTSYGASRSLIKLGYHFANIIIKEPLPFLFIPFADKVVLLPLIFIFSILAAYLVLKVPVFFWYYAPYYPLIFLVSSVGAFKLLQNLKYKRKFISVFLTLFIIHQLSYAAREIYLQQDDLKSAEIYKQFALNVSKEKNVKIVIGDIGIVGYYSNAYIFDLGGLVSPRAIECYNQRIMKECLEELKPDYFVIRKHTWQEEVARKINCTKILAETKLHLIAKCA